MVNVQESAQHVTPKVPPSRTMSMGAGGASSNSTPPGEEEVYIGQSGQRKYFWNIFEERCVLFAEQVVVFGE